MKVKNVIIYGVIAALCLVAFGGYFLSKGHGSAPAAGVAAQGKSLAGQPDPITKSDGERQRHVREVMARSIAAPSPNPVVGIGTGTDFASVTAAAIQNAGGLGSIIKRGDVVLLKPNLCIPLPDGSPQTTDYRVMQEIVNIARTLGAAKVVIAEGSFTGNAFDEVALKMNKYDRIKGVTLYNFNANEKGDCYELTPRDSLVQRTLFIPKLYMDADVVITVAKLKTHFMTRESLSLKNVIGVPPDRIYGGTGDKTGLHNLGLNRVMIDLNRIRKPDFAVIDGIIGGQGWGPVSNTPVKSNVVFAGTDLVALDTVACGFMGVPVDTHIELAARYGLGIGDMSRIKIAGAQLDAIKMRFE